MLKSQGNLNNGFGLPLQLLRLETDDEFAVVEMGMNHLGEIASLARIAVPDWGVVTNVGNAHVENFSDGQAGIARAKFELVEALPANGIAFLNCSDPFVSQFGRDFPGRVIYFGAGPCADPQTLSATEDLGGLHVKFRAGEREGSFTLQMLGAHNATNAMAGLAVALEAGVDLVAAVAALESLTPGDKRGEVIELNGAIILNDSYNSNPEALQSMIRTLAARPASGRRILVAGEMLELGKQSPALHAECGRAAAEAGIDLIAAVQGQAKHLATAACAAGVASVFLPDAQTAGKWLIENLRPGDVALVKGCLRGVHLERAIEAVKEKFAAAGDNVRLRRFVCGVVLLAWLASVRQSQAATPPEWTHPFPPFRIAGNLYYVGSQDLASYLIATPQGLILINSSLEASVPLIKESIETLGFRFSDIKILLISHAHYDHCAGSAKILKLTGAKYYVMDADVPTVESGGKADFFFGSDLSMRYPPAHVDRVLHDGNTVSLGGSMLTAHLTAGHTPGATTWTIDEKEDGRLLHAVIVGSITMNTGYKLVDNKTYPQIAADYKHTFAALEAVPCDIFLAAHGSTFHLAEKYPRWKSGDKNAFLDPEGFRAHIESQRHSFDVELARQLSEKRTESLVVSP